MGAHAEWARKELGNGRREVSGHGLTGVAVHDAKERLRGRWSGLWLNIAEVGAVSANNTSSASSTCSVATPAA
jgi:hypothetical protein